jgi:hypothetical protein
MKWIQTECLPALVVAAMLALMIIGYILTLAEYVSGPAAQLGNCPTSNAPYLSFCFTCTTPSSLPPASRATMERRREGNNGKLVKIALTIRG